MSGIKSGFSAAIHRRGKPLLIAFNKPFGVLSQFSARAERATLADHLSIRDIYPCGRLDADSEGLLLLTNDGGLQHRITQPRHRVWKTYLVQVEGVSEPAQLSALREGVRLKDGPSLPGRVRPIAEPDWLWPRDPPIRYRAAIPTHWLELQICEGRNRQVRRMTAAVGLPTLRLVRIAVGTVTLDGLAPGAWRRVEPAGFV